MTQLDDHAAIERIDSLGVLGTVEDFPDQVQRGWELGRTVAGLPDAAGLDSLVVLGMGGSAAAGDLVAAVSEPRFPVPIVVIKSYGPLPEWVGRNTLAVAISYSGNTEETLAAFEDAHARGARALSISSGGRLAELASDFGAAHVEVPPGLQPRAALGFLAMPLLSVLAKMGLLPAVDDDLAETGSLLDDLARTCERRSETRTNPAKALAVRLYERVPVIYGGRGLGAAIARRFKCDINEYAQTPAFFNEVPEMGHNEICAWTDRAAGSPYVGVMVRDVGDHPLVAARFDITRRLIEPSFSEFFDLETRGESRVARALTTLYVTQLAAIYLAVLRRVDPGPVEVIDRLKRELAAVKGAAT